MDFLHRVQAVVVTSFTGGRIFAKYFTGEDTPETSKALVPLERQRALEASIAQALRDPRRGGSLSQEGDILLIDGHAVLYHVSEDVTVMVIGAATENELVLFNVLHSLVDALKDILNSPVLTHRLLLENYDALLLVVDEMLDEGIILESDSSTLVKEVGQYLVESNGETARKALSTVNRYLRENL